MREFYQNLIKKIGDSPYQTVISITGGGISAISGLLKYNSKILLEATLPYNNTSLVEFIGGNPEKFCSLDIARSMAAASFRRCLQICEDEDKTHLIGLGACSSLDKKEIHVAIMTPHEIRAWTLIIRGSANDLLVAEGILAMLGSACQISGIEISQNLSNKITIATTNRSLEHVLYTQKPHVVKYSIGEKKQEGKPVILFPGSFDPVNESHIAIAEFVYNFNKQTHPINFEIAVNNIDKPFMDYFHMHERTSTIRHKLRSQKWSGDVYFTNMPRFFDKSQYFKNCQFIIGIDTLIRMGHNSSGTMIDLMCNKYNTHFFCFPRKTLGRLLGQKDLPHDFPKTLLNNTVFAPESISIETASTEIKNNEEL